MSHADAWACVALDCLQSWRLIPLVSMWLAIALCDSRQDSDSRTMGAFFAWLGTIWIFVVIGYQGGWWI